MKDIDVLVVGELNIDIILDQIEGFPVVGKEIISNKLTITLGSSSAIFASNLSTLGANVAFIGKIGKDGNAELVKSSLQKKGVSTEFVIETEEHNTGITVVLNYDTDRANVTYPGAMNHFSGNEVSDALLSRSKHMHISSIFMQPALKKDLVNLLERAKSLGLSTSVDPQWDPSEKWDLDLEKALPLIDIFLPNTKELQFITKCDNIQSAIEKVNKSTNVLVIKDGEHGAHLYTKDGLHTKPAYFNSNVIDCIGAGDSFDAGFISQYIKGEPLENCLDFGNISGAMNTTQAGGTAAFESLSKFKESAKQKFSVTL